MKASHASLGPLVLLGLLWATWPGAPYAWLAVLSLLPLAVLVQRGNRHGALLAAGAAGLVTALLPAGLFDWRPWAGGLLLLALVALVLGPPEVAPRPPRPAFLAIAGGVLALLAALRLWTPARAALLPASGVVSAVVLLAAVGAILVIVLTGAGHDEEGSTAEQG